MRLVYVMVITYTVTERPYQNFVSNFIIIRGYSIKYVMAIGKIRIPAVILETTWTVRTDKKSMVLPSNFSPCQYDKAKVSSSMIKFLPYVSGSYVEGSTLKLLDKNLIVAQ